jgi:hypothetical protein
MLYRQTVITGLIAWFGLVTLSGCTAGKHVQGSPTPANSSTSAADKPSEQPADTTRASPAVAPTKAASAQKSKRVASPNEIPNKTTGTPAPKVNTPPAPTTTAPQTANSTKTTGIATAPAVANQPSAVQPVTTPSTLDLAALEQRLRDTRAIGAFTKLSLKNQVDDLLDDFQQVYGGKTKTPMSALRERYDLLMMKVLSLLQNSDAALAASIRSSREAIWNILKDPKQFSQIRSG